MFRSLYNILFKDANEMSIHTENRNFQTIIESYHFKSQYPIYGYLLELQSKRGLQRKILLKPAKESLSSLTGICLPDSCSEAIFKYLFDRDLEKLIKAKI